VFLSLSVPARPAGTEVFINMLLSTLRSTTRCLTGRALHTTAPARAKIVCVLYPDPEQGFPPKYARDDIPAIMKYPDGMTTPSPSGRDFTPGHMLGCLSGGLGLRKWAEANGHQLVITADKDGEGSELERELVDADYVISQPFYPAYMTRERLEKAKNLKMALTAGIGSDHVDLSAAMDSKVDIAEVTFCNSISVAEHVVMQILALVRNYLPAYNYAKEGGWNIADCVSRSYDLEGRKVGTVASGRIGLAVLKRLHPFDVELHYCDRHRLPLEVEKQYNLHHWEKWTDMVKEMDVVTLNCPLHPETEHMVNAETIKLFKRGAYLVNTARGKLCDRDVVASACEDGTLAGYAGDVWFPQPPPADHPWRSMPWHGMTPHMSGTSLSAQMRYADGVREILENHMAGKPIREEYQIVTDGALAGMGAHSYSKGDATGGSEEAVGKVGK